VLYKVVRYSMHAGKRTIQAGLYEEECQKICHDPETSSKTATSAKARKLTKRIGPWFYGYTEDR